MSDTATTDRTPTPGDVAAKRAGEQVSVTGAQSLVLALEAQGVETVFGLPGGTILPTYDPLLDSEKINHILVRHEQGAGHAAEGFAAATGRGGHRGARNAPATPGREHSQRDNQPASHRAGS